MEYRRYHVGLMSLKFESGIRSIYRQSALIIYVADLNFESLSPIPGSGEMSKLILQNSFLYPFENDIGP